MMNGILQIIGGLVLTKSSFCSMNSVPLRIFQAGNVWAVAPVLVAEAVGAKMGVSWPRVSLARPKLTYSENWNDLTSLDACSSSSKQGELLGHRLVVGADLLLHLSLPAPDQKLYTIFSVLHFGPGGLLMLSWGLLLWACIRGPSSKSKAG